MENRNDQEVPDDCRARVQRPSTAQWKPEPREEKQQKDDDEEEVEEEVCETEQSGRSQRVSTRPPEKVRHLIDQYGRCWSLLFCKITDGFVLFWVCTSILYKHLNFFPVGFQMILQSSSVNPFLACCNELFENCLNASFLCRFTGPNHQSMTLSDGYLYIFNHTSDMTSGMAMLFCTYTS